MSSTLGSSLATGHSAPPSYELARAGAGPGLVLLRESAPGREAAGGALDPGIRAEPLVLVGRDHQDEDPRRTPHRSEIEYDEELPAGPSARSLVAFPHIRGLRFDRDGGESRLADRSRGDPCRPPVLCGAGR